MQNQAKVASTQVELDLNQYAALIFDLDGTLVDSSIAIKQVLTGWCEKHQIDLEMLLQRCHGARIVDFLPDIAPELDINKEVKYLADLEAETTLGLIEIPGAKHFLEQLSELSFPWAIATSGTEPVASLRLSFCQLIQPNVFITSECVVNGKPAPDPFLLAAEELGYAAKQCLVFEDSDNGVRAAILAGCDVVVIGDECSIESDRIVARCADYQSLNALLKTQQAKFNRQDAAKITHLTSADAKIQESEQIKAGC